jgi:hypothetical protein
LLFIEKHLHCLLMTMVHKQSLSLCKHFFGMALQSLWALAFFFPFPDLLTIGRNAWASDQLVARPLPKHRRAQTQNKHIYTPNIHALSGIQTHNHSIRASEDSSCLRPLGYHDWLSLCKHMVKIRIELLHLFHFIKFFVVCCSSLVWVCNYSNLISIQEQGKDCGETSYKHIALLI